MHLKHFQLFWLGLQPLPQNQHELPIDEVYDIPYLESFYIYIYKKKTKSHRRKRKMLAVLAYCEISINCTKMDLREMDYQIALITCSNNLFWVPLLMSFSALLTFPFRLLNKYPTFFLLSYHSPKNQHTNISLALKNGCCYFFLECAVLCFIVVLFCCGEC